MKVIREEFSVLSSDGIHQLAGVVFCPLGEAKGFFHVVHGMTEYIGRYEKFMNDMAQEGWICFGYDNLGHGHTANDPSELGFIAARNGWDLLAQDVKVFSEAVFEEYGREKLPYCLMGHSMGSFIVRVATEKYVKPDSLVIMGTGGANPAAGAGVLLTDVIKLVRGPKHISKLVGKLAFGNYNKRYEDEIKDAPEPWLTTDTEIRNKYKDDPYCTFKFTVSAMGDLIRLTKYCNRSAWYKALPVDLPVLLVSGEEDPVGDYGRGIRAIAKKLGKRGMRVKCILYKGGRHEILNDFTYQEVKRDILDFFAELPQVRK